MADWPFYLSSGLAVAPPCGTTSGQRSAKDNRISLASMEKHVRYERLYLKKYYTVALSNGRNFASETRLHR